MFRTLLFETQQQQLEQQSPRPMLSHPTTNRLVTLFVRRYLLDRVPCISVTTRGVWDFSPYEYTFGYNDKPNGSTTASIRSSNRFICLLQICAFNTRTIYVYTGMYYLPLVSWPFSHLYKSSAYSYEYTSCLQTQHTAATTTYSSSASFVFAYASDQQQEEKEERTLLAEVITTGGALW